MRICNRRSGHHYPGCVQAEWHFFKILIISGLSRGENKARIQPVFGCRFFRGCNPHQLPPSQTYDFFGLISLAVEMPQHVPGVTPASATRYFPVAFQPIRNAHTAPPDIPFPLRTLGNSELPEPAWGLAFHADSVFLPTTTPAWGSVRPWQASPPICISVESRYSSSSSAP